MSDNAFNYLNMKNIITGSKENLDFFTVYLKESGYIGLCAEFPRRATAHGEMRVNCEPSPKIFSEVQIVSTKNKGFDIAEIEVFVYGKRAWLLLIIPLLL